MKGTRLIMGMPVTVDIADTTATAESLEAAFEFFRYVDETFSTYKPTSEISRINQGLIAPDDYSEDVQEVFALSEVTKRQTGGYFDIKRADGSIDPAGLVKGWAIQRVADLLTGLGFKNFFVDAGGDVQANGLNAEGQPWRIGIRDPFKQERIVKVAHLTDHGIATSGTYIRGQHIWDPHHPGSQFTEVVSLTVIGPNVYEADRYATAAFAMGRVGIAFIERTPGLEGYMIDKDGIATMTTGFETYTKDYAHNDR